MIRALIIRRRGIKLPHLGLSLFRLLAAAAMGEALNILDGKMALQCWGSTTPRGRTDPSCHRRFFFPPCLALVLVFLTSQMNLEGTGIHPPRARSHPAFKAASKSFRKAFASPHFGNGLASSLLLPSFCSIHLIMN